MRRLPLIVALLGGVLFTPLASAQPLPAFSERALAVESAQAPLIYAAPAPGAERIHVAAELNRPDGRYALGETVEIRVRVDRPSHVTILNVAPNGALTILYPNQFNQQNFLTPGQDLIAPGPGAVLRVAPPVGREMVKVIASEQPLPLVQLADFRQVGPFLSSQAGAAEQIGKALVVEAAPAPAAPAPAVPSIGIWGEKLLILETHDVAAAPPPVAPAPLLQTSGFTLTTSKPSYRVGEAVGFWATTDRPCHLTLLAVSSTGQSAVIFPHDPRDLRRILPGGPVEIPGAAGLRLTVNGPARQETVVGLCATEDRPVVASNAALLGAQGAVLSQNAPFSVESLQALYESSPPPATAQARVSYAVTP